MRRRQHLAIKGSEKHTSHVDSETHELPVATVEWSRHWAAVLPGSTRAEAVEIIVPLSRCKLHHTVGVSIRPFMVAPPPTRGLTRAVRSALTSAACCVDLAKERKKYQRCHDGHEEYQHINIQVIPLPVVGTLGCGLSRLQHARKGSGDCSCRASCASSGRRAHNSVQIDGIP